MKKFKNGVPMLGKSDMAIINRLVMQGYYFNVGNVVISLHPKPNHRGKNIKVAEAYVNRDSSRLFIWYKGYHYCFISSSTVEPLNLRKKRVVRFYKKLDILEKKGFKRVPLGKVI